MTVLVTTEDTETGETETSDLSAVTFILVCNEEAGVYVASRQDYKNGTTVLTIKRREAGK